MISRDFCVCDYQPVVALKGRHNRGDGDDYLGVGPDEDDL